MSVSILDYGGIITKVRAPDRSGKTENVVLGYEDYAHYEKNPNFFGALIGPVAGRIQDASFKLDGETYQLEANEGSHHLHGGAAGFHQVIWQVAAFQTGESVGLELSHTRPDGTSGYPGNLDVTVTYTLTNDNKLLIDYQADTDKPTPLALTNHTFFNLSGDLKHTVHHHEVTMNSSHFLELDQALIPTGRKLDVSGTTFDFRKGRELADGLNQDSEQHQIADNGYDHYFIIDKVGKVVVREGNSGRVLTIQTTQPGMVMYTANGLDQGLELAERLSEKYLGVCFETQGAPASLFHPDIPSVIVKAGEPYHQKTVFSFDIDNKI